MAGYALSTQNISLKGTKLPKNHQKTFLQICNYIFVLNNKRIMRRKKNRSALHPKLCICTMEVCCNQQSIKIK